MPTYDYKCSSCGHVFEEFHGMNDQPKIDCPQCQSTSEKQFSFGASIHFKGSGFYVNDYKPSEPSGGCAGGSCGV